MKYTTLLIDGNALSYMVKLDSVQNKEEYAKAYFNKIKYYAKNIASMSKVILFFDNKTGGTWRDKIYPDYQKDRKAKREKYTEKQLEELKLRSEYIKYIKTIMENSGYSYIDYPNTEADDLISLYCYNIQEENESVIIFTTDRDLFQLINENKTHRIKIYFLVDKKLYTKEKDGKDALIRKIILGDSSDSIPSVCKNVGQKTFNDFLIFLDCIKQGKINLSDDNKTIKKISESLNINYIPSFSNYNEEQHRINETLINLKYVNKLDKEDGYIKTNYIKEKVKKAKISPFAFYKIKY